MNHITPKSNGPYYSESMSYWQQWLMDSFDLDVCDIIESARAVEGSVINGAWYLVLDKTRWILYAYDYSYPNKPVTTTVLTIDKPEAPLNVLFRNDNETFY